MKKVLKFLCSMGFANALMILLALLSGVSSLIPQGESAAYYIKAYPGKSGLIRWLQLDDVFHSWYFAALMGLLCLSMLLCTGKMLQKALRGGKNQVERAAALPNAKPLDREGLEKLRLRMAAIRCKEARVGESYVFHKNSFGRFGTFLIHAAILLVVLFGIGALYLPQVQDLPCMPGESVTLADGTRITVDDYRMDAEGEKLDYSAHIRIRLADGRESESREVKVNQPMSYGSSKVFLWQSRVTGAVTATNAQTGETRRFYLANAQDEAALDGYNGVILYGLRVENDPSRSSRELYATAVYEVQVVVDGMAYPAAVSVGESLPIGDWTLRFDAPTDYPLLRVKQMPIPIANRLLEIAMVLLLAGLFLSFYLQPVLVKADEKGYTVAGPRPEKMRLELERLLEKEEGEKA